MDDTSALTGPHTAPAPISTTLERIRRACPDPRGWTTLLRRLGKSQADDEPIAFATLVECLGLADALWCLRAETQLASTWQAFALRCAARVRDLAGEDAGAALDVAASHARGEASDEQLMDARTSACATLDARYEQGVEGEKWRGVAACRAVAWAMEASCAAVRVERAAAGGMSAAVTFAGVTCASATAEAAAWARTAAGDDRGVMAELLALTAP